MSLASLINKQTRKQEITTAFADSLLVAVKLQNPPRRSIKKNIKPSKTKCQRQMYYILTGGEPNKVSATDPKMTMIQKIGTFIHGMIQETLVNAEKQGIIFRDPREVVAEAQEKGIHTRVVESDHAKDNPYECNCFNDDLNMSFMFDGAIEFQGHKVILEIKSEDYFKFIRRIAPEPEHIDQATHYCMGLGYDAVLFLYIDRNYLNPKCYYVHITEENKLSVMKNIFEVHILVDKGELPPANKCTSCKYCDYTKICKSNVNPKED